MLDVVVLYRVDESGTPHPVVSSGDMELVAAVTKLVAAKLGLVPATAPEPERTLRLMTRDTGGQP